MENKTSENEFIKTDTAGSCLQSIYGAGKINDVLLDGESITKIKSNYPYNYQKPINEIVELKQQLAEKDKEIEMLHKYLELDWAMTPQRVDGKTWTKIEIIREWEKEIRHQVCDMARKKIVEATCYDTEEEVRNVTYDLNASEVLEILDQIEKGEIEC